MPSTHGSRVPTAEDPVFGSRKSEKVQSEARIFTLHYTARGQRNGSLPIAVEKRSEREEEGKNNPLRIA